MEKCVYNVRKILDTHLTELGDELRGFSHLAPGLNGGSAQLGDDERAVEVQIPKLQHLSLRPTFGAVLEILLGVDPVPLDLIPKLDKAVKSLAGWSRE